jgi:hypothetical protein
MRVEKIFGPLKTVAGLREPRHHGVARPGWMSGFTVAACNFVRICDLALANPQAAGGNAQN